MDQKQKDFFKKGTGHIVSSSHNDIAWWNTPYKTMEYRDLNIITPAIEMVGKDPQFKHTMECVLYLMEYIQRHPEQKEVLHQLALEKRLMWGATYTQPYENMLNDEALVRQVYLGKKWFEKEFSGIKARVAWSPDVPARSMQFPQILSKAGIDYLMISRVDAGAFEWFSPDGSSVKGYSTGHYFTSARALNATLDQAIENVAETLESAKNHYLQYKLPPEYLFLSVADYVAPKNYKELIEQWPTEQNRVKDIPTLKHSSIEEFMEAITVDPNCKFRSYHGERPNEWAYIHGATHHKEIAYGRKASITMPEAEMFSTISCLLNKDFTQYPTKEIEDGWKYILYPDHGFGGGNGHITDKVFGNALKKGLQISERLKAKALNDIAAAVDVQKDGFPIIIFNTKGVRSDVVRYSLDIRNIPSRYFKLEDEQSNEVDYQIVDENNAFELTIEFIATDVPAIGYKTYYIRPTEEKTKNIWLKETHLQRTWLAENENYDISDKTPLSAKEQIIENQYYKIVFSKGGLSSLFDKQLNKELLDITDYMGFELFMMQSKGTGAGEFQAIEQPTFDFADAMKNYDTEWEIIEDGTVKTSLVLQSKFSCCYVVQTISIYHSIKKIDCDIELISFDGTPYREFRFALPLAMQNAQIAYDVPMGVVEIGKDEVEGPAATEFFKGIDVIHYPVNCSEIHPREVQNWMSASDSNMSVVLSSDVSMFDYKNPRNINSNKPMLQPILLASRRSCHGWGNEYLQMGSHCYHFSFTSGEGSWRENHHLIEGANTPLIPVTSSNEMVKPYLPSTHSFFSIDQPNVVISAIKKCEDDNSVIVRTYENHGCDCEITVKSFLEVKQLIRTDMIENEIETLNVENPIMVGKRSIDTFKIKV